jgi:hypothetical protein
MNFMPYLKYQGYVEIEVVFIITIIAITILMIIYWISSPGQPTKGGTPAQSLGVGLTAPRRKKISLLWQITRSLGPGRILWINDLGERIWIWDLVLGMLGVCYRAGSLWAVVEEISKYKLDLVEVQEVWWRRWHRTSRRIYIFLWTGEWESWIRYRFFRTYENHISS